MEHHAGTEPAEIDTVNAAALGELGLTDYEQATYERAGRKLHVKAARFSNATGSFGAFTLFTHPDMVPESIGSRGMVENGHILFYKADILINAVFDTPTVMSAAELRALSDSLPTVSGGAASLPEPVKYLPPQSFIAGSDHYAVGPATFSRLDSGLPVEIVGFDKSVEIAVGDYRTGSGTARLTVLSYPTPQIAMDQFRKILDWVWGAKDPSASERLRAQIEDARRPSFQGTLTTPLNGGSTVTFRRSGPILVLVSGAISRGEAVSLVQSVNYDADVRMLQAPPTTMRDVTALIVGCFILIALIVAIFLVLGFSLGGLQYLLRRFFPGYALRHAQHSEIIKLNLND